MKPYERLTDDDIDNIKKNGSGSYSFILTVIVSVSVTLIDSALRV